MSKTSDQDIFSWLNQPSISSVASCQATGSLTVDEAETILKTAHVWPDGYPDAMKKDAKSVRFHYRKTNSDQAINAFANILIMYRSTILNKYSSSVSDYPYLQQYLISNHLGLTQYPHTNTIIYKNATTMARATPHANPGGASSAPAANATQTATLDGPANGDEDNSDNESSSGNDDNSSNIVSTISRNSINKMNSADDTKCKSMLMKSKYSTSSRYLSKVLEDSRKL